MLTLNQRSARIVFNTHYIQAIKERAYLFRQSTPLSEQHTQCISAIKDPQKGVFIPDHRNTTSSDYSCIFISDKGLPVCLPCRVTSDGIFVLTIKGVRDDYNDPNWCVRSYNRIAESRNMESLSHVLKPVRRVL